MTMGREMKLLRFFSRIELQKVGFAIVAGCLLVSLVYVSVFKFDVVSLLNSTSSSALSASPSNHRVEDIVCSQQLDERSEDSILEKKLMCNFSSSRTDICEIEGDVRILGKKSSIFLVDSRELIYDQCRDETWWIKPYPRKSDKEAMRNVRELTLRSLNSLEDAPRCTDHHHEPAIVFSVRGYTKNYFHAFTDVLVPLFETSYDFNREVRFLVTDFKPRWINRFLPIFKNLSRYDMINLDKDERVLCFPRAIVGLRRHADLSIDPSPSPNGYSIVDFVRFMRRVYSLERDSVVGTKRPRLLIITREETRKFVNTKDIARLATEMGYEVVVSEGQEDVAHFSRVVNSCDVMMGVHGAGLTNIVFLPTNAVLIQIVPWGGLIINWAARICFGEPSKEMKLKYLEYSIGEEESTVIGQYMRNHSVFKDPGSIRKQGWNALKKVFLDKQDVNLDLRRFKPVLERALELLHTHI